MNKIFWVSTLAFVFSIICWYLLNYHPKTPNGSYKRRSVAERINEEGSDNWLQYLIGMLDNDKTASNIVMILIFIFAPIGVFLGLTTPEEVYHTSYVPTDLKLLKILAISAFFSFIIGGFPMLSIAKESRRQRKKDKALRTRKTPIFIRIFAFWYKCRKNLWCLIAAYWFMIFLIV